jgi:mercuric ion binding protein
MRHLGALVCGVLMVTAIPVYAGEQSVTLKVTGMTCASCPYQVRSALKRVDGVKAATANLEQHNAVVTFDDAVANIAALTKATTNAGFPSEIDESTPSAKTKGR